jgi:CTP:molybdopterin cytidylyltransferase MocA
MTLHPVPTVPIITGVILAGGLGTRMDGVDKGLQLLRANHWSAKSPKGLHLKWINC